MNGTETTLWNGTSSVSRAEELLSSIDRLLRDAGADKRQIGLIAVSAGPGSFTGIRIGIATALGLKAGLGIPMASASALRAMASMQPVEGRCLAALPVGRDAVCIQTFQIDGLEIIELDQPHTIRKQDLRTNTDGTGDVCIAHSSLYELLDPARTIDAGENIASAVGQLCIKQPGIINEPLFVSKSF
jgi:tRNA threonylcarbamoyl adenosine modification protein YeaZ